MAADERTEPVALPSEGGDPACWAHLVCPACGRILPHEQAEACPACGAASDLD